MKERKKERIFAESLKKFEKFKEISLVLSDISTEYIS